MTATPSAPSWSGRASRRSFRAWKWRTNPQSHAPERYKARNAVERGLGWLKWVAARGHLHDKYEYNFLFFCT